jgi:histidine triad (HIT) family protein
MPELNINQIKNQLIQQIESNYPEEQKSELIQQISSMNDKQLIEFLKQNNLIGESPSSSSKENITPKNRCIFCSIIEGKIPSYKIDENKDSIAVLEINPISKAHSLIIPKKHIKSSTEMPTTAFSLSKKISGKIKTKFNPKEVSISSANLFGHEIINILPIYKDENMGSKRKPTDKKELEEIQKELEKRPTNKAAKVKVIKNKKKDEQIITKEQRWLPNRKP